MEEELLGIIGYHGTEIKRGNRFIDNKAMEKSAGDKHWLGDGSYFYEELFYAYKWIKDMFYKREQRNHKDLEDLIRKYIILICNINVEKSRVFDLDKYEFKYIFDYFFEKLEKEVKYSERFNKYEIADGVVINIMFNEYKYIDKYDMVIASFPRRNNKYKNNSLTRLKHVLEKQICVKNVDIVKEIDNKNFNDEYTNIKMLSEALNREINLTRYSSRRTRYSKESLF